MTGTPTGGDRVRVAVIGGSLGGLNAALWLLAAGCDVEVFERSPHPLSSRGAGIVVQDDTVAYLRSHGIPDQKISTSTSGRVYIGSDGRRQRVPGGQRFTSWNTLYRHLHDALPADRYHLDRTLTGLCVDADGVDLDFADGPRQRADLVVGADGPRSTIREQLLPGTSPQYAGYVAWRGLLPERDAPADAQALFADTFAFAELPHSHALCYPIPGATGDTQRGGRLLNWLWYRTVAVGADLDAVMTDTLGQLRSTSLPPGAVHPGQDRRLRADAAALLPLEFAAMIAATPDLFLQQVVDLSVPRMAFDRVALIGDAAFVPRPHTAGSTMKAANDSHSLATTLTAHGMNVPAALTRWEPGQLDLGRSLQHQGRTLARSAGLGA